MNIIEKYCNRPLSLSPICLLEFAAEYESTKSDIQMQLENDYNEDDEPDPDGPEPETTSTLNLLRNKGRIKKRHHSAIVKHPYFDPIEDKDSYLYCLMLLYFPFRDESFCNDFLNIEEAFKTLHAQFRTHQNNPIVRPDLAQEIDSAVLRMTDLTDDTDSEISSIYLPPETEEIQDPAPLENMPVEDTEMFDLQAIYNGLSEEQKEVFRKVDNKLKNPRTDPLRLKVLGEGGTGNGSRFIF